MHFKLDLLKTEIGTLRLVRCFLQQWPPSRPGDFSKLQLQYSGSELSRSTRALTPNHRNGSPPLQEVAANYKPKRMDFTLAIYHVKWKSAVKAGFSDILLLLSSQCKTLRLIRNRVLTLAQIPPSRIGKNGLGSFYGVRKISLAAITVLQ